MERSLELMPGAMRNTASFFKRTFIAGFLLLLPMLIIWVLFSKVWHPLLNLIGKLSDKLHIELFWGVSLLGLVTVLAMVLLCFLLGLVARFAVVTSFHRWVDKHLLQFMPGYEYVRAMLQERLGVTDQGEQHNVLVFVNGSWQPALLVEERHGWLVVFVPLVPASNAGTIHIIQSARAKKTGLSPLDFRSSIQQFGKGLLSSTTIDLQELLL